MSEIIDRDVKTRREVWERKKQFHILKNWGKLQSRNNRKHT